MGNDKVEQLVEIALRKLPHHDISGALEAVEEASLLQPNNPQLINIKGNCYYLLGDFYSAKLAWEEVLAQDNNNSMALSRLEKLESPAFQFWLKRYYQAIGDIENKDFLAAQHSLLKLMKENDGFVSLYQLLGLTYLALQDEKNALKVWQQGLKLDVNNEKLINYISTPKQSIKTKKLSMVKPEKAGNSKNQVLMIASGMFVLLLLLQMSITFNNNQGYKDTIQSLQDKISILSEQVVKDTALVPVIASSLTTDEVNDKPEYEELSNEGANYDVSQEKHYYQTGYQAYQAKEWKTAISNLGVVVTMQSQSYINREALYYLALSYYSSSDYNNAEKYFFKYLEQFPDTNYTDESLYYLGGVFYYQGNEIKAKEMLQALDEFDPSSGYKSTELYQTIMN